MVLCSLFTFLAVNFDWSIILIRKSFGASRHISEKHGVKLAIANGNQPVGGQALVRYCNFWLFISKLF